MFYILVTLLHIVTDWVVRRCPAGWLVARWVVVTAN